MKIDGTSNFLTTCIMCLLKYYLQIVCPTRNNITFGHICIYIYILFFSVAIVLVYGDWVVYKSACSHQSVLATSVL